MGRFIDTKRQFKHTIQELLKSNNSYTAAMPAYAHKNPIIDYIFWQRVEIAYNYATQNTNSKVLDFGCGTGLLSYLIANDGINVVANDVDFSSLSLIKKAVRFPANIQFMEGDLLNQHLPENSFDLIIALDVLEHINNLDDYITLFEKLLNPGGAIIVSGPTESILYKIGRKLAGEQFTGNYHVNNIKNIREQFEARMETKVIKRLIWPLTLFEIFISYNDDKK
jgi:2-polyprenyl-3-methyl-5-hydroxy-6-metoxy-1,4-benzoquinol methylase